MQSVKNTSTTHEGQIVCGFTEHGAVVSLTPQQIRSQSLSGRLHTQTDQGSFFFPQLKYSRLDSSG